MKKPDSINFFSNGATMVFDDDGEQILELQNSWFRNIIQKMIDDGVDLFECDITMPNGRKVELISLKDGDWNWKSKD